MGRTTQSARKAYADDGRPRRQLAVTWVKLPAVQTMPPPAASSTPHEVDMLIWKAYQNIKFGETDIITHAMPRDYDRLMGFPSVREMLEKTGTIQIGADIMEDPSREQEGALACINGMLSTTDDVGSGRKPPARISGPDPDTPVALTRTSADEPEGEPEAKKARTDVAGPAAGPAEPPEVPKILPAIPVTVLMRPPEDCTGGPWYEGWE